MSKIDFNSITEAAPEKHGPRVWRIRCYTKDGADHLYPYSFGTLHAAKREADRIVKVAASGARL